VTEIRSFRRVFDLERRIYSVDRLRLNPAGVPVRGVMYLLAAIAGSLFASAAPLLGPALGAVPWYLRELAAPAALATVLAVIRVDGRTFHLAAAAQLRLLAGPRRVSGLRRGSRVGVRWRPADIVFLPDGSDPRLRALCYTGPGSVLVLAPHRRQGAAERQAVGRSCGRTVRLSPPVEGPAARRRQVIVLEAGARLVVAGGERGRRR
jgi:hypothetical protein